MRTHSSFRWALVTFIVLLAGSMVLSGCCGLPNVAGRAVKTKAAQALATGMAGVQQTPEAGEEATVESGEEAAGPEATSEPSAEKNLLDNLVKLAPVHIKSSYELKEGDRVVRWGSLEGDIDANGNQHLFLTNDGGSPSELYLIDGALYIKSDDSDQFVKMEGFGDDADSTFAFIALYGGAYMLAFNNLQEARMLGSESVNGYNTQKYEFKSDLASLGVSGLAAGVQGATWEYQNMAWIETSQQAIVKGLLAWVAKGADDAEPSSFTSSFDAMPGTVKSIQPPDNVLDLSAMFEATATPES
ncbi:MAG: hypothetical protein ACUVX9_11160 [Anaerolineae bacterium]